MAASKIRLSHDEKRVIGFLRVHGPTCRSDIALGVGLSNFSLTQISKGLLAIGLIEEASARESLGRGRPSIPLRISAAGGYAMGAAFHAGMLSVALIDYAGRAIADHSEPFDSLEPSALCARLRSKMSEMADHHRLLGTPLLGVGISLPDPSIIRADPEGRRRENGLEGWWSKPVAAILETELGVPVWIDSDANTAALAEFYLGGLVAKHTTAVVILLSHGLGAGMIVDGRLLKGENGRAGDIGALYRTSPKPSALDLLAFLRGHGVDISSVFDIEAVVQTHDGLVRQWVLRAAGQLEWVIDMAQAWFNPGATVISSPLPYAVLEQLVTCLKATGRIPNPLNRDQVLEASKLGGAATALGAALLPIHSSTTA